MIGMEQIQTKNERILTELAKAIGRIIAAEEKLDRGQDERCLHEVNRAISMLNTCRTLLMNGVDI